MKSQAAAALAGQRILVVEDAYWIAADVSRALTRAGAEVIGPAGCIEQALDLLRDQTLDAAVLDIDLDGATSFPLARELEQRGVPVLFATAYDQAALPEPWQRDSNVTKPFSGASIVASLSRILLPDRVPDGQLPTEAS